MQPVTKKDQIWNHCAHGKEKNNKQTNSKIDVLHSRPDIRMVFPLRIFELRRTIDTDQVNKGDLELTTYLRYSNTWSALCQAISRFV